MHNTNTLVCLYCGDIITPNPEMLESVGGKIKCCDHFMVELDMSNLYKLTKGLDKLKTTIESEIVKGFG